MAGDASGGGGLDGWGNFSEVSPVSAGFSSSLSFFGAGAATSARFRSLTDRIRAGTGFELGPFKFAQLDIVAIVGQPVPERDAGEVKVSRDPSFQDVIVAEQKKEEYVFLVHLVSPRQSPLEAYEVVIYLAGHFNKLEHVTKVEHFLGSGWDDAVFTSEDRDSQFAIKVGAIGSFLAMARVHFFDGKMRKVHSVNRFVELKPLLG